MKHYTILAFMLDTPGVLNKIVVLIRRKMYNIDTLTVCSTEKPGISRMTITLASDDEPRILGMLRQIEKITEVISAVCLDPVESFCRELALVKVDVRAARLISLQKSYDIKLLDEHDREGHFIVQMGGTTGEIDRFLAEFSSTEILETARTGPTAMGE